MTRLQPGLRYSSPLIVIALWLAIAAALSSLILGIISLSLQKSAHSPAPEDLANQVFEICMEVGLDCYSKYLGEIAYNQGFTIALQTFHVIENIDPSTQDCHTISHAIGASAVRAQPESWRNFLDKTSVAECGGGFLHGVLEAWVATGAKKNLIDGDAIKEICLRNNSLATWTNYCSHFMGHIALVDKNSNIQPALEICQSAGEELSPWCKGGIFMEDSSGMMLNMHGLSPKISNPVNDPLRLQKLQERCLKYHGSDSEACWADMGGIFLSAFGFDTSKSYSACKKAPEEPSYNRCWRRIVAIAVNKPQFETPQKLKSLCEPFTYSSDNSLRQCINIAIGSLISSSIKSADKAITFCNQSGKLRNYCIKKLESIIAENNFPKSELQQLCLSLSTSLTSLCSPKNVS